MFNLVQQTVSGYRLYIRFRLARLSTVKNVQPLPFSGLTLLSATPRLPYLASGPAFAWAYSDLRGSS
jgi:hypothetical protein